MDDFEPSHDDNDSDTDAAMRTQTPLTAYSSQVQWGIPILYSKTVRIQEKVGRTNVWAVAWILSGSYLVVNGCGLG